MVPNSRLKFWVTTGHFPVFCCSWSLPRERSEVWKWRISDHKEAKIRKSSWCIVSTWTFWVVHNFSRKDLKGLEREQRHRKWAMIFWYCSCSFCLLSATMSLQLYRMETRSSWENRRDRFYHSECVLSTCAILGVSDKKQGQTAAQRMSIERQVFRPLSSWNVITENR